MDMTLGQLSAVAGAIVTIWGAIALIYKPFKNFTRCHEERLKKMDERLEKMDKRIQYLEKKDARQDLYILDSAEQRKIFLNVCLAMLEGLKEHGINGHVTIAYDMLLDYMKEHPFQQNL